jgi:NO-binding membrane sensor protein with MHYT domain/MFS family permease
MMTFGYDFGLVLLSAGVMLLGSFSGLVLLTNLLRARPSEVTLRLVWAATVMGGGLWAMQFIGFLAIRLPVKLNFDVRLTIFSAVVVVSLMGLGLAITREKRAAERFPLFGPLVMAIAVLAMHLIGLQSLRGPFILRFNWTSEAAIGAGAAVTVWLWLWLALSRRGLLLTVAGTVGTALALLATHYLAMHNLGFAPARPPSGWVPQTFSELRIAWSVTVAVYLVCSLGVCTFMILQFRGDSRRQKRERAAVRTAPGAAMAFSPAPFRLRTAHPEASRRPAAQQPSPAYGARAETLSPSPPRAREPIPPPQYQLPARIDAPSTLPTPLRPLGRGELATLVAAASAGTILEWYDFYLYATLAQFFAAQFFPAGNETAALLAVFAAYAAGFVARPLGALIFGRAGDLYGRKYTFLVTITIMGFATSSVGLLPTFAEIGWAAPALLVLLRLAQGLALGGEYGGAATYVGEAAWQSQRGYATGWIQATATLGFFLSLAVVGLCRTQIEPEAFAQWGWRIPFLLSLALLALSVVLRRRLKESRVFEKILADGRESRAPLRDSFLRFPNVYYVLLALLGAVAGQAVVWYAGQFYALSFLTVTLKLDFVTAYQMMGVALLAATPFFIFFGWLSDRIGRLKIILAGCLLASLTYFPLFHMLTAAVNPTLAEFNRTHQVVVHADPATCGFLPLDGLRRPRTDCDDAREFLSKHGVAFRMEPGARGDLTMLTVDDVSGGPWDAKIWKYALGAAGFPKKADVNLMDFRTAEGILFLLAFYVTMVYGPIAAFLVELFPANIRYTSMSLPHHIGNGWLGGGLPFLAASLTMATGDVYAGLWFPVAVAGFTFAVGVIFLRDQKTRPVWE